MNTQAVNQFLQKVTEDPQLQEELAKALEAENDREAVTNLAVKHGYQFTPDELWAEIQSRQSEFQQKQDTGELNEEELEAVAGGLCFFLAATAALAAPVAGGAARLGTEIAKNAK